MHSPIKKAGVCDVNLTANQKDRFQRKKIGILSASVHSPEQAPFDFTTALSLNSTLSAWNILTWEYFPSLCEIVPDL